MAADLPNFGGDAAYLGACVRYLRAFVLPDIAAADRRFPLEAKELTTSAASAANRVAHQPKEEEAALRHALGSFATERYSIRRLFVPLVAVHLMEDLRLAASDERRALLIEAVAATFRCIERNEALACPYEAELTSDPTGVYARMTRQTKHDYRLRIEVLADRMGQPPDQVARDATAAGSLLRRNHDAMRSLGMRAVAHAAGFCAVLALLSGLFWSMTPDDAHAWAIWAAVALATLSTSEMAAQFVDRVGGLGRRHLDHSLDFVQDGLPKNCATAILVPMLLQSKDNLHAILKLAERNYRIANDTNVAVVLLADFLDARNKEPSELDLELLSYGEAGVAQLNVKYGRDAFFLIARGREFAPDDREWRGSERKRGKIEAFSALVAGRANAFLNVDAQRAESLRRFKFAFCIDEDTKLTRDCVQHLAGALAHPSNAPMLRVRGGRRELVSGHVAAVPAIMACKKDASRYPIPGLAARTTIDADSKLDIAFRSTAFDVFGVELNRGKIFYDIRAHDALSEGRYPIGVLLSHDTIESDALHPLFVGTAALAESVPDSMLDSAIRSHRWMRGDLQNLAVYLFGHRRSADVGLYWKIVVLHQIRNLSLPIATFSLAAWAAMDGAPWLLTLAWGAIAFQAVLLLVLGAVQQPARIGRIVVATVADVGFKLASLPLMAAVAVDAMVCVGCSLVTRRGLMRWRASSFKGDRSGRRFLYAMDLLGVASAVMSVGLIYLDRFNAGSASILAIWMAAPLLIRRHRKRPS
ncbi:hypothetical protein GN331_14205 [Lysobacter sp. HX-5-24]|uniref:Uncharacterized protein n=1 Tax=Noviluteimonas gilva TaxID=2682097 RepID=A0A7C9HNI8_9GAMM|nr:hypothetical protein [Lysobacter gilvus]